MDDALLRLVTLLESIKGEVNIEKINEIKKEIYSGIGSLGINIGKVKKLFKEYVNSFENDDVLSSKDGDINEINDFINKINSIIHSKNVNVPNKVKNSLIRFLRISYRIKGLDKSRNFMEEKIVEGLRNDTKIENVKKGRKNRTKNTWGRGCLRQPRSPTHLTIKDTLV